jgi:hypothetical protein
LAAHATGLVIRLAATGVVEHVVRIRELGERSILGVRVRVRMAFPGEPSIRTHDLVVTRTRTDTQGVIKVVGTGSVA